MTDTQDLIGRARDLLPSDAPGAARIRALQARVAELESRGFIEFAPSFKTVQGRTFWYAEGWVNNTRFEYYAGEHENIALKLCSQFNAILSAALARKDTP